MKKKIKALVLFSGGLDSMLAAKILALQGIEVTAACFKSNFYNCERARISAEQVGTPLKEIDITDNMIEIVKNPPSGYGKNLNPCIDCHAMMIRTASEYIEPLTALLDKEKEAGELYDFIATGEVLGQRPFSQNRESLDRVMNLAGYEILRPLSAKLLPETNIEKQGLVIRGRLLDISGRGRERQMELAKKYGLTDYPTPAGGCLLTDPAFCERLLKMLDYWPGCNNNDIELLKNGRIFWVTTKNSKEPGETPSKAIIVVGRNEKENQELEKLAQEGDIMVQLKEINGPTTLIRITNYELRIINTNTNKILELEIPLDLKFSALKFDERKNVDEIIDLAALLSGFYSTKARGKKVMIEIISKDSKI